MKNFLGLGSNPCHSSDNVQPLTTRPLGNSQESGLKKIPGRIKIGKWQQNHKSQYDSCISSQNQLNNKRSNLKQPQKYIITKATKDKSVYLFV